MTESTQAAEEPQVELRNPATAAILAWLIPGWGHLYQGRTAKAVLYFVCIVGTFSYGAYLGSDPEVGVARVVYCSWRPSDKRLYFFPQACVGLPAMPAVVQAMRAKRGATPLWNEIMAPPRLTGQPGSGQTLDELHRKLHGYFELGTIYTVIAGLLNVLAIYDAWGGPVFYAKDDEDDSDDKSDSDTSANE